MAPRVVGILRTGPFSYLEESRSQGPTSVPTPFQKERWVGSHLQGASPANGSGGRGLAPLSHLRGIALLLGTWLLHFGRHQAPACLPGRPRPASPTGCSLGGRGCTHRGPGFGGQEQRQEQEQPHFSLRERTRVRAGQAGSGRPSPLCRSCPECRRQSVGVTLPPAGHRWP